MTKKPIIQPQDKYVLRLPDGMRDRLKRSAEVNNRSMNAEIIDRLEESFRTWPRLDIPADLYERVRRARNFQRIDMEKAISKAAAQIIEDTLPSFGALHRDLGSLVARVLLKASDEKREQLGARFKELLDEIYVETDDRRKEPEI